MDERILRRYEPEEDTPWFLAHGGGGNLMAEQTHCTVCRKALTKRSLRCDRCCTAMHGKCYRLRVASPADALRIQKHTLPQPIILCRGCRS
jgi:hypothetical protein